MNVLNLNKLALDLVARDFSDDHNPTNAGPTKTSRALAILHLAARDAYAKVTKAYPPRLAGLPDPPKTLDTQDATGTAALLGAGLRAAKLLYPDDAAYIDTQAPALTAGAEPVAVFYGFQIADLWFASRQGDGSAAPQLDDLNSPEPGRHRRDPVSQKPNLGRAWGNVTPFVLQNVATDAKLVPPPGLTSTDYAAAYDDVFTNGRDDLPRRAPGKAAIGIFWGYDGANKLGTPPRLYNQVVVASAAFQKLAHPQQVNVLAAIHAAMADAGIAAWYWKYVYDFWRPVVAIREADAGWGPTGKGDGNKKRKTAGDPFWLPFGAPASNPVKLQPGAAGANFTPNFPAYPSGHATFGTACFETFARLLGKKVEDITVTFTSDELNGVTKDNEGVVRPRWQQTFTLAEAIEQNKISRIDLGVHWIFDATGGADLGLAVAKKVVPAF